MHNTLLRFSSTSRAVPSLRTTTTKTEYKPGTVRVHRSSTSNAFLLFPYRKRPELVPFVLCILLELSFDSSSTADIKIQYRKSQGGWISATEQPAEGGKIEFQPPDHDSTRPFFPSISRLMPSCKDQVPSPEPVCRLVYRA